MTDEPESGPAPAVSETPYPGLWQALFILAEYTLVTVLLLSPLLPFEDLLKNPAITSLVTLLATAWILRRYRSRTGMEADAVAGPFHIPLVSVAPIGAVVFGLVLAVTPILLWLMHKTPWLAEAGDYGTDKSPLGAFLFLLIVAPVSEELLFRGILLRGFVGRYGERAAIPLSALLFALAHVYPIKFLSTYLLGILLAWLTVRFGSIWPAVMAQTMNNAIGFLAYLSGTPEGKGKPVPAPDMWTLGVIPVGIVMALAGFSWLRRIATLPEGVE